MIEGISALITGQRPVTPTDAPVHPACMPLNRFSSREAKVHSSCGPAGRTERPARGRDRKPTGHNGSQSRGEHSSRHIPTRLLQDGRLQIGIAGFHDTAFAVEILQRHDSTRLAAAMTDLPCRVKMVTERNIAEGVEKAMDMLTGTGPGRRGIVLITSGDTPAKRARLQDAAERAAASRIGIHVICLGVKPDDLTGGPRINTKDRLGYGGFHWADTPAQLLQAIRDSFEGLTPAFGMTGTNKAMILLDCSETMVEDYRGTTRVDMVITAVQKFLAAPLVHNCSTRRGSNGTFRGVCAAAHPVRYMPAFRG